MAQGTFDILHPGHIYYLEKSAELGEKLVVVVARDSRVKDRKDIYFDEKERKRMLEALEAVDKAVLGSEGDIYSTVRQVDPDVITIGYDQDHSIDEVRKMAEKATEHTVKVQKIDSEQNYSSSNIKS